MEVVENLLQALGEALQEGSGDNQLLSTLVANIEAHVFSDLDAGELESATSLLFQSESPPSFVKILKDNASLSTPYAVHGKKNILKCLSRFIKERSANLVSQVGPFFSDILDLYCCETRSQVTRGYLLLPLKEILKAMFKSKMAEHGAFVLAAQQALIPKLKDVYEHIFTTPLNSKFFDGASNVTAKGDAFIVIGLVYNIFSTDKESLKMGNPIGGVSSIMRTCWHYLQAEMRKGQIGSQKSPSMEVIGGILSCLDRMLYILDLSSCGPLASGKQLLEWLLQIIKCVVDDAVSRYRACNKALRLLKNHCAGAVFSDAFKNSALVSQVYHLLHTCHEKHKKTLLKHDEGAVVAALKQLSNVTIKNPALADHPAMLKEVMKTYLKTINFQPSTASAATVIKTHVVLLAVRGLATIAPAIAKIEQREADSSGGVGGAGGVMIIDALLRAASMLEYMHDEPPSGGGDGDDDGDDGGQSNYSRSHGFSPANSTLTKTTYFLLAIGGTVASSSVTVGPNLMDFVKEATIDVIQGYPTLPPRLRLLARHALCYLSQGLVKRGIDKNATAGQAGLLADYLSVFIPNLFLHTLSRNSRGSRNEGEGHVLGQVQSPDDGGVLQDSGPEMAEQEQPDQEDEQDEARMQDMLFGNGRLVGKYLGMWLELLAPEDSELRLTLEMNSCDYASQVAPRLLTRLFAEAISTLRALDLSYDSSLAGSEDVVIPNKPVDHDLLLNLTTFFHHLLVVHGNRIKKLGVNNLHFDWMRMLVLECVEMSEVFPVVSALYRLVRSLSSTNMFDDETAEILREFFLRLEPKLTQFTDELLDAVLAMLLDARRSILPFDALLPSLVVAFSTGRQVVLAVETLEKRLFEVVDPEDIDLDHYLPRLLPLLDSHLTVAGTQSDKVKGTIKIGNRNSGVKSAPNAGDGTVGTNLGSAESSRAILRLLGRLGGNNQHILRTPQEAVQSALSWSPTECITLNLEVHTASKGGSSLASSSSSQSIDLSLTLDRLLPRVVELCSASNLDTSLRVTAAESLHAIVLFLLGKASQTTLSSAAESPIASIYSKVFPPVIELAVGSGVIRVLFEKLLFQVVRWFSGHNQVHHSEVSVLIDAIMDGLCDTNSGGSREICARAIAEFYDYALKQGTKKELHASEGTTSSILLNRLFSLCAHPSEDTRMGAAIAFRGMYKRFREESSHVARYSMQIVSTLLRSMRLGGSPSFLAECSRVVDHYCYIVAMSLTSHRAPERPADWAGLVRASDERLFPHSLANLVFWLWEGFGAPIKLFRRACMTNFARLCPLLMQHEAKVQDIPSRRDNAADLALLSNFFRKLVSDDPKALVLNLETDSSEHDQLRNGCPEWDGVSICAGKTLLSWLQQLVATLDSYIWLVTNNLVGLEMVFAALNGSTRDRKRDRNAMNAFSSSVILECITSFATSSQRFASPQSLSFVAGQRKSKELLLLCADVEVCRQETLEKVLWFLSECLRSAVKSDRENMKVVGQQGHGLSAAMVRLLRDSRVWDTPFQDLVLRYLLATSGSCGADEDARGSTSVKIRLRNRDIPKMAEEFLSFLPLLEESSATAGGGLGMEVVESGSAAFYPKLSASVRAVAERLGDAMIAKDQAAIVGFALTIKLLFKLQLHHGQSTDSGVLERIWGPTYRISLRQNAAKLVFAAASSMSTADPKLLSCIKECLVLALDMGYPWVDAPDTSLQPTDQCPTSLVLLLVNGAGNKCSVQNLVKFVDENGDLLARQLFEGQLKNPNSTRAARAHLISSVCSAGKGELPMRVLAKALAFAVTEQQQEQPQNGDLPWQADIVAAFSGNFENVPFNELVLLLELDAKSPYGSRSHELLQFVRRKILKDLTSPELKSPTQTMSLLPFVLSGAVAGCPRPFYQQNDDDLAFSEQLTEALEEMAAKYFPRQSKSLSTGASLVKVQEFSLLFHAFLDAFAATGSILLLRVLLPGLAEGRDHLFHSSLVDSFSQVVNGVTSEATEARDMEDNSMLLDNPVDSADPGRYFLLGCLSMVFDNSVGQLLKFKAEAKKMVFTGLCLPTITRLARLRLVEYARMKGPCLPSSPDQSCSFVKQLSEFALPTKIPLALNAQEADSLLTSMAGAYSLLELVFDLCPLASLKTEINASFCAKPESELNGKEMGSIVIKAAYQALRKIPSALAVGSSSAKYNYQSSAFSFLAIAIAKTQPNEAPFNNLVLCPSDGGQWTQVVDTDLPLDLSFDKDFEKRIVKGLCVSEVSDAEAEHHFKLHGIGGGSGASSTSKRGKVRSHRRGSAGIMTQFAGSILEFSSLSQNLSKSQSLSQSQRMHSVYSQSDSFNVDNNSQLVSEDEIVGAQRAAAGQLSPARAIVTGFDDQVIELEMKDFNTTPAMVAIVRLVTRLHTVCESTWTAESPPAWVMKLAEHLSVDGADSDGRSRLVRLFFLRLILNSPVCSILRRWAQFLLGPILKVALTDLCGEEQLQHGIHYFLRDVIILFSETWAGCCIPSSAEEANLASRFLTSLFERSVLTSKLTVLKLNLRTIHKLIEEWLPFNSPSSDAVQCRILNGISLENVILLMQARFEGTGGLRGSESSSGMIAMRKRLAGMELLRILLMTRGPLLQVSDADFFREETLQKIVSAVVSCIEFPRKEVYEAGSLMCGTLLKVLSSNPRPGKRFVCVLEEFKPRVIEAVERWLTKKDGANSVASCLCTIVSNYPSFLERRLFLIMISKVSALKPRAKYELLKALHASTGNFLDGRTLPMALVKEWPLLLTDLSTVSFGRLRNRVNIPCVQLFSLKILSKHSTELDLELLEELLGIGKVQALDGISLAVNEKAVVQIREEAYNFLIAVCTSHCQVRLALDLGVNSVLSDRIRAIRGKAITYLLRGITDPDTDGLEEIHSSLLERDALRRADQEQARELEREEAMERQLNATANRNDLPMSADAAIRQAAAAAAAAAAGVGSGSGGASGGSSRVGIRRKVLDFFSAQFGMSTDPFLRLHALMNPPLFDPTFADQWLHYTSYLMLSLCKASPRYTAPLFESLVHGQVHVRMPMRDAISRSSRLASAPRFSLEVSQAVLLSRAHSAPQSLSASQKLAASQLSQFKLGFTQSNDVSQRAGGFLRGTQALAWSQTQSQSGDNGAASQLLPGQVRYSAGAGRAQGGNFGLAGAMFTQGYLAGEVRAFSADLLAVGGAGAGAGAGSTADAREIGFAMPPPLSKPSWIITKQRPPSTQSLAAEPAKARPDGDFVSLAQLKTSAGALDGGGSLPPSSAARSKPRTVVYRKYRDGELPDVCVSHADVLQPLQALCLRDSAIASDFFQLIFESLYLGERSSSSRTASGLRGCLLDMLASTASCQSTALISGLLASCHLCLRRETTAQSSEAPVAGGKGRGRVQGSRAPAQKSEFVALVRSLPSSIVADRAQQTLNFHSGISLLEEQIIGLERLMAAHQPTSRAENEEGAEAVTRAELQRVWRDLARLYEGLGDRDVLLGLASRMSRNPLTQQAVECELGHDYAEAVNRYHMLLVNGKKAQDAPKYKEQLRILESRSENDILNQEKHDNSLSKYQQLVKAATDAQAECGMTEATESLAEEMHLWSSRALECCKQLCDWSELRNLSYQRAGLLANTTLLRPFDSDMDDEELEEGAKTMLQALSENGAVGAGLRDQVLPYYLQALLGDAEDDNDAASQELKCLLDMVASAPSSYAMSSGGIDGRGSSDSTAITELKAAVESRLAADYASALAFRGMWGNVRVLVDDAWSRFTKNWAALHPCAVQARRGQLQGLTRLGELDDAARTRLSLPAGVANNSWEQSMSSLAQRWVHTVPGISDPLWVWDGLLRSRRVAFKQPGALPFGAEPALLLSRLHASAASAAVDQGILDNHYLAINLKGSQMLQLQVRKRSQPSASQKLWTYGEAAVVVDYHFRVIDRKHLGGCGNGNADEVDKSLNKIEQLFNVQWANSSDPCTLPWERLSMELKQAEWHALRHRVLLERGSGEQMVTAAAREAQGRFRLAFERPMDVGAGAAGGVNPGSGPPVLVADRRIISLRARAAGGLTKICLTQLQQLKPTATPAASKDVSNELHDHQLASLTIRAFLDGLELGSAYCREQLLQLFSLLGRFPQAAVEERASLRLRALPPWIFLTLSATLFGCLDKPEGPIVVDVLESVAARYPNALHYPFRVTSEYLTARGRSRITRLQPKLTNASVDAFIEALQGLSHPELRLSDAMKDMNKLIREDRHGTSRPLLQKRYIQMCADVLSTDWELVGGNIGSYNAAFAKKLKHKVKFADIVGAGGEKLLAPGKGAKDALDSLDKECRPFTRVSSHASGKVNLGLFSQWLQDFDATRHKIEVPGQYMLDTDRPPQPERHAHIVSFDQQVLVMNSIRKPKRIRIHSTGGSENLFLVKGGEDLRNDERIQQLFAIMNSVVAGNDRSGGESGGGGGGGAASASKTLRLRTYTVVPMTLSVGILEWVGNTTPLKKLITDGLFGDAEFRKANPDFKFNNGEEPRLMDIGAADERHEWLMKTAGENEQPLALQHRLFKEARREDVVASFEKVVSMVPSAVLRLHLLQLAPAPEAFLTLRDAFARSLSMTSICGYILGIGDRHLDNLLLESSSGTVVPIDFGVSFGIGAAMLPVPELIPFRLTRILRDVLQPLDGRGLLRHFMVHALVKLRSPDGASLLGSRLEGYVNDPLIDWISLKDREDKQSLMDKAHTTKFEPRRRVEAAMRKLKGECPVKLMTEDLQENGTVKQLGSLGGLTRIMAGATAELAPVREGRLLLTPTEQVDALLCLATDPEIAMHSYSGLNMWL